MMLLDSLRSRYMKYNSPGSLIADEIIDLFDPYSAYRINEERILLTDPYSMDNLDLIFLDDIGRIYVEWALISKQFILLLIANSH